MVGYAASFNKWFLRSTCLVLRPKHLDHGSYSGGELVYLLQPHGVAGERKLFAKELAHHDRRNRTEGNSHAKRTDE
jgi:hypothetical protein